MNHWRKLGAAGTVVFAGLISARSSSGQHSATFTVKWTGPNGPSDCITIVPAGSPSGTWASYAYTVNGSPVTLTAPDTAGNYELWYASDRVKDVVFGKITIVVT